MGYLINYDNVRKFLTPVAVDELSKPSEVQIARGISMLDSENLASIVDPAIDNFDQNEETIDGKCTTHAMAIVMYQRSQVTRESSLIPCTKQKFLDTTQYKEQLIQWYRKPAKKPEPSITYQSENKTDFSMVLIKYFIWKWHEILEMTTLAFQHVVASMPS